MQTMKLATAIGFASLMFLQSGIAEQAKGPRELLATVGIDDSVFAILQHADFDDPTSGDISAIDHISATLQRFDLVDVERWRKPWPPTIDVASMASLLQVDGVVEFIEPIKTPVGGIVYRAAIQLDSPASSPRTPARTPAPEPSNVDLSRTVSVWSKQIPAAWKSSMNKAVRITAACDALLINAESPTLVTSRFKWFPQEGNSGPATEPHLTEAAKIGIDVSRFVEIEHGKKVSSSDRECFYQMLSRSDRIKSTGVSDLDTSSDSDSFDIVEFLQNPAGQTGRVYRLNGIARRAIRIPVRDLDVQTRFGIDHYYELDVFVPMKSVLILQDEKTGENVRYDKYPMTFCVRELPVGFPEGPVITQAVSIQAMYFKLWAYRNELLNHPTNLVDGSTGTNRRQQSPLFMAHSPTMRISPNLASSAWDFTAQLFGLAFAVAVVVVATILYRNSRRDDLLRRKRNPSETISINLPE